MTTQGLEYALDETGELRALFRRDGFLIIKNAVPTELLDRIRWEIEETFVAPSEESRPELPGINVKTGRFQDAWRLCPSVSALAGEKTILHTLEDLFGRSPHPFQTLTFSTATQQKSHSDHIHFSSRPLGFMCGVWVALQDVTEDNGPLFYYPGSHNLPYLGYADLGIEVDSAETEPVSYGVYEDRIDQFVRSHGFKRETFTASKGDLLIWAANLVHGGSAVTGPSDVRWSQVTHYYFDDCLHYTPRLSDEIIGEFFVRQPVDVCTSTPIRSLDRQQVHEVSTGEAGDDDRQRDEQLRVEVAQLKHEVQRLKHEIAAIRSTKTFRYTKQLRRIYRRLRPTR